jgi:hypothetical protein
VSSISFEALSSSELQFFARPQSSSLPNLNGRIGNGEEVILKGFSDPQKIPDRPLALSSENPQRLAPLANNRPRHPLRNCLLDRKAIETAAPPTVHKVD